MQTLIGMLYIQFHFFKDQILVTCAQLTYGHSMTFAFKSLSGIQIPVGKQIIYIYKCTNQSCYDLGVDGFFFSAWMNPIMCELLRSRLVSSVMSIRISDL